MAANFRAIALSIYVMRVAWYLHRASAPQKFIKTLVSICHRENSKIDSRILNMFHRRASILSVESVHLIPQHWRFINEHFLMNLVTEENRLNLKNRHITN